MCATTPSPLYIFYNSMLYTLVFVEIKEAVDILSHVDDDKITLSDLDHVLKCLNVNLTDGDFREALKHCDTSGEL